MRNHRITAVSNRHTARLLIVLFAALLTASGSAEDSLLRKARHLFTPIPLQPPELKDNPLTPSKIELGKLLFFDQRLSSAWTVSCNSCHNLSVNGADALDTSVGHNGQKGTRNSPTVFNAVFNFAQFWDGRARNLREQAKGPIQAAVEMNNTPARVVQTLKSMPAYVALFKASFPNETDPVTFDHVTRAIEAFEATLLTPNSRFDQFLSGSEQALNEQERRGLALFIAKDCASCHKGVNLGGASYHRFGVAQKPVPEIRPPADKGRFAITGDPTDEYVFRAPSLRNVEITAPYFHSGRVADLKQAINVMMTTQLGIRLKEREVEDIEAFLKTLTGERPKIAPPSLPAAGSETPPPVTSSGEKR
ncbi:MAG: cytochrome-c peroxidase [Blastocatellia bacterium]